MEFGVAKTSYHRTGWQSKFRAPAKTQEGTYKLNFRSVQFAGHKVAVACGAVVQKMTSHYRKTDISIAKLFVASP